MSARTAVTTAVGVIGATQEPRTVWTIRGSDLQCCLNQQRAPEGIRTPNLLIRSENPRALRAPRPAFSYRHMATPLGHKRPLTCDFSPERLAATISLAGAMAGSHAPCVSCRLVVVCPAIAGWPCVGFDLAK
jgi:hypothetical protein